PRPARRRTRAPGDRRHRARLRRPARCAPGAARAGPGRAARARPPPGVTGMNTTNADARSRLRLVVVQALVFSLFATLLVRLWYLRVATGEEYSAQAAAQSVRELVVQPQRGLIVDDQGRPLVPNRTSWVVSLDRAALAKMPEDEQGAVLRRVAKVPGVK